MSGEVEIRPAKTTIQFNNRTSSRRSLGKLGA